MDTVFSADESFASFFLTHIVCLYHLSVRFDFHMIDSLSLAVHDYVSGVSMSFSFDETLLPPHQ